MRDDYSKIEEARNLVPVSELHPAYPLFLFLSLRTVGYNMKKAVTYILTNYKVALNYTDLYDIDEPIIEATEEKIAFANAMKVPDKQLIEELQEKEQIKPHGNLGQLIWVELIVRRSEDINGFVTKNSPNYFKVKLSKIRKEIINHPNVV